MNNTLRTSVPSAVKSSSLNSLSHRIIGCAMKVHSALGPGLLEYTYEACIEHELRKAGLAVKRQAPFPVHYDGVHIDCGYRIDLLVERQIIIELKSIDKLAPIHEAQILTYLKLAGINLGLLINFNVLHLRAGSNGWSINYRKGIHRKGRKVTQRRKRIMNNKSLRPSVTSAVKFSFLNSLSSEFYCKGGR
ncbi:MAG: GxxExxY protein [Desulfobacteraceae bacterium]|nr:MAG: GxxExxY protein [Desulfobacteraceae bacterium]